MQSYSTANETIFDTQNTIGEVFFYNFAVK